MVIFWLLLENQGILGRLLLPLSSQNIIDWNTEVFPGGGELLSNQQKYGKSKWATNEVKKKCYVRCKKNNCLNIIIECECIDFFH